MSTRRAAERKSPCVIGAVGLNGSGKDMLVQRLHTHFGVSVVSFGDIARELAAEHGIYPTRDNLHEISMQYIARYGATFFPKRAIQKILDHGWTCVAVSGVRTPVDASTFAEYFKDNFLLVHIDVPDPNVRFQRMRLRAEPRDPQTLEEFLRQDANEARIFQLHETIRLANYALNNEGTLEAFCKQIDAFAIEAGLTLLRARGIEEFKPEP